MLDCIVDVMLVHQHTWVYAGAQKICTPLYHHAVLELCWQLRKGDRVLT